MKTIARNLFSVACLALLVAAVGAQEPSDSRRRRSPVVDVFEQSRNAVVNISTTRIRRVRMLRHGSLWDDIFDFGLPTYREQPVQSVGSGVVIHEKGYIVTNAHVVAQTSDVSVAFADKHKADAEVVAVDAEHDLAVLKIESDAPLPYVRLGRSDDIMVGETVVAIGNPLGLEHTVTAGIVSALNRDLHFGEEVVYRGLIQTDAAINPGNSGGPLLNIDAQLIGINTAIRGDAQNVGFAIPVDRLWELLPRMLDIERQQRVRFGLEVSGPKAEVVAVHPDSPAARAGLQRGDRLTHFQNHELRNGIDYYVNLFERHPGEKVELKLVRGDQQIDATVPLQPIPPPDGRRLARQLLGAELAEFDERARRRYELPRTVGVYVDALVGDGPAETANILPGDVILTVNRTSVATLEDVGFALEDVQPGSRVYVHGLRVRTARPFSWEVMLRTDRSR